MRAPSRLAAVAALLVLVSRSFDAGSTATPTRFASYAELLAAVVHGARVDYQALADGRAGLDDIAGELAAVSSEAEQAMPPHDRMAFWINAYNLFTLRVIVDHYPIRGSWFSLAPRNSIRQIDGVWTSLTWRAAGRSLTLDHIEHEILRPLFKEPRVHFAINCASVGCPPLNREPYVAARLDAQLDEAARRYLASPSGLQISGDKLKVSSILKWYGEDFGTPRDTAVLAVIERFGPPAAAALAASGRAKLEFLDYDWSLNDTASAPQEPLQ